MRTRSLLLVPLVAALFALGWLARGQLDLGLTAESIQASVRALGWLGPAIFVGLVTFRHFILLPSSTLWLLTGGLLFPLSVATVVGGLGIFFSALLWFALSRVFGRDWVRPRLGPRFEALEPQLHRAGPWVIGFATAHPISPMTGLHMVAGVATLPILSFALSVGVGSPLRAFTCSYFGATLLEPGSTSFLAASAILAAVTLLPLAHPGVRARLFPRAALARTTPGGGGGSGDRSC